MKEFLKFYRNYVNNKAYKGWFKISLGINSYIEAAQFEKLETSLAIVLKQAHISNLKISNDGEVIFYVYKRKDRK
jgi:hypothetical protein